MTMIGYHTYGMVFLTLAAINLKNPFKFVKLVNRECLILRFPLTLLCFVYVYKYAGLDNAMTKYLNLDMSQPVGLLWMSDRPEAETSTDKKLSTPPVTPAQIYAPKGGVPIRNSHHDYDTVFKVYLSDTGSW